MQGFLLVDKPTGMTSRDLVLEIVRECRNRGEKVPVGHCGTLDPLASGLMLIAVGAATPLTPYFQGRDKRYIAEFRLGVTSESMDLETETIEVDSAPAPTREGWESILKRFSGRIQQVPPKYSAVRVDGKRAYQLAREGRDFQVPPREIEVMHLEVLRYDWPNLTLDVHCSGGTYIRTLGDDLAKAVGTRAVMTSLRRTASCHFSLTQACRLETLKEASDWGPWWWTIPAALPDVSRLEVNDEIASRVANGLVPHALQGRLALWWQTHVVEQEKPENVIRSPLVRRERGGEVYRQAHVLLCLEDETPIALLYRRPEPGRTGFWRIELNWAGGR